MDYSPSASSVLKNSPGKNTGVACRALLQGIFLTKGLNPHLLYLKHWEVRSLPLVPPGKPSLCSCALSNTYWLVQCPWLYSTCTCLILYLSMYLKHLQADIGEGNGTHSSTLAWKIPWMEEPGGLQSMGSLRVGHD